MSELQRNRADRAPGMTPKSPNSSTMRAFAQSAGAKLLIIALNAATGILTARALAPEGRGQLSAMLLWYVLLASLFTLGIPSALTYQLRSHPDKKSEVTGVAFLVSLTVTIAVAAVAAFLLPYFMPQYPKQVIRFARIFLLNTPIATFFLIGRAAVESQGEFNPSNLSLIVPPTLTLLGLLVLRFMHVFTPVNAAWCYALAGLPSLYLMAKSVQRSLRPKLSSIRTTSRLLLAYGIRSYGIDLCGTMSIYIDQAFVVRLFQPAVMGTYVVALSLSRMLNAFHTAVVMVLFPKAVSRSAEEVIDMTGRAVRLTTLLTTACGLGVMFTGPKLLALLYGPEYRAAASVLRILVLEVILAGATQVMSQAFMALARPGVVTALQALGLALVMPLMFFLVPRFGIEGAALSLLFSTSARFLFVLISFPRFLGMPHPRLLIDRSDLTLIGHGFLHLFPFRQNAEAEIKA